MKLTLEKLTFYHDEHPVFRGESLDLAGPGLVAIFGPNGGGKTTLIKLIAGLEKPTSGKLFLDGLLPSSHYPRIGFVPQLFQVDPLFPISVNDIVYGGVHSLPKKERSGRIQEALERVGMENERYTDFAALSGGERTRVLLARALAPRPSLLLLDEVTAHMDVNSKNSLFSLLSELKNEILILFVTHELSIAQKEADQLLFVDKKISKLRPTDICNHFQQGLYHPPLQLGAS
jgi:zinc transport system ATP-binding protein